MPKKIVIIGANASGVDAAVAARKTDREAEIVLLTKENVGAYSRCGLPFVLSGHIPAFDNLIVYSPTFYRMMKFDLRLETAATNIDTKNKKVEIETKDGKQEILQYDSLIIATGGAPFNLPIEGMNKEGVFNLHTLKDGERLANAMKTAQSAIVIGSGLVGLEAADAFREKGIKTTIVEMLQWILPRLIDQDMSEELQKGLEEKGIRIILGKPAGAILGTDKVQAVAVGGEEIPADIVVNAAGVRPNVELAKKAGIVIGETGGIKTNIRMQTSAEGVYAVGDCAETTHMITHRPALPMLGSTAVREGKVAGINAVGGYSIFPGTLFSWVSKIFDFEVGATGLTEFWASRFGMEVAVGKLSGHTKAVYYPGATPLKVKIIVEKETKQIVGGEIVGGEEVTQRINALSIAIQNNMTVQELMKADTCYAPSVCETWEPIVLAAEMAMRRL
jgi:NADH oxidase (H2O2-forming)